MSNCHCNEIQRLDPSRHFRECPLRETTTTIFDQPLRDIQKERIRQEDLRISGKFLWTLADSTVSPDRKMTVVSEEVGEVAKEIVDYGITRDKYNAEKLEFPLHRERYFLERIREELVQVAACCVAWIESIDILLANDKSPTDTNKTVLLNPVAALTVPFCEHGFPATDYDPCPAGCGSPKYEKSTL